MNAQQNRGHELPQTAASAAAGVAMSACTDVTSMEVNNDLQARMLTIPRRILPATSKPSDVSDSLASHTSAFMPLTPFMHRHMEQNEDGSTHVCTLQQTSVLCYPSSFGFSYLF